MQIGILFDCDGVLTHSEPLNLLCWQSVFESELGITINSPIPSLVGLDFMRIVKLFCHLGHFNYRTLDSVTLAYLLDKKITLFKEYAPNQLTAIPATQQWISDADAMQVPRVVISAALRRRLLFTLDTIQLNYDWRGILSGEDMNQTDNQPPKKNWSQAAKLLHCDLFQTILIEDSAEMINDAKQHGVGYVIGLIHEDSHQDLAAAGADYVTNSLSSLSLSNLVEVLI